MKSCPLYNNSNLNFTGNKNPYGLIQNGGKRKIKRSKKTIRKRGKGKKTRKNRR